MTRLFKVLLFALLMFCAVFAVVIGGRLDESVITLIGGIVIGCLLAAPVAAILMFVVLRRREASSMPQSPVAPPQSATQFLVLPPMYGGQMPQVPPMTSRRELAESYSLPVKRRFYLIGEDGQATEIQPDDSLSAEDVRHVR